MKSVQSLSSKAKRSLLKAKTCTQDGQTECGICGFLLESGSILAHMQIIHGRWYTEKILIKDNLG